MIRGILAHCTVTDIAQAEDWYTELLGRGPGRRPMPGLIEWQFGEGFGMQVWSDPERAGRSTVVLEVTDIDGAAARASDLGFGHEGLQPGGDGRVLPLRDPDGNLVVLMGA